jgi:hypothetical protein
MIDKKYPTDKLRTNSLGMILVVVGFVAVISFLTIIFSTQDPLWFTNRFDERPEKVVVYHNGAKTEYVMGKDGFMDLAEGVRLSLAGGVQRPSGIGLSPGSVEDAYNLYTSVEAFFPYPVKVHTWFNTGNPTRMLFLITGRHSGQNIVFMGNTVSYFASGPILNTMRPLLDAVIKLGYPTN